MNKISWSEIRESFPEESVTYEREFSALFDSLGKTDLTLEDLDVVLTDHTKNASFSRMFYDNFGMVLGRIDTDDLGDSRCFDRSGNYMGSTFGGMTFDASGGVVAQSDVL